MDVRGIRKVAKMSQAALAAKTGIDRSRISFAENGYVDLRPDEESVIREAIVAEVRQQNDTRRQVLEDFLRIDRDGPLLKN